jgi:hypothetical protein
MASERGVDRFQQPQISFNRELEDAESFISSGVIFEPVLDSSTPAGLPGRFRHLISERLDA